MHHGHSHRYSHQMRPIDKLGYRPSTSYQRPAPQTVNIERVPRPRPRAGLCTPTCLLVSLLVSLVLIGAIAGLTYFLVTRDRAVCDTGYRRLPENGQCFDVDECVELPQVCTQGCINSGGSYRCTCNAGFKLDVTGRICQDVNECLDRNAGCEQECKNTLGSFYCECSGGYNLDPIGQYSCQDIDECSMNSQMCKPQGNCYNSPGSYSCDCPIGMYLEPDQQRCRDVDECAAGTHQCSQNCQNTDGSYICNCNQGYELASDKRSCQNIDECALGLDNCEGQCFDKIGTFDCVCAIGWELSQDDKGCKDYDECSQVYPSNGGCQHTCANSVGSFQCSCNKGHELAVDKLSCVNVNECVTDNGGCEVTCGDNDGSYKCSCPDGYTLNVDNRHCLDIDECSMANGCTDGCENTIGSYICTCPVGYEVDNVFYCQDIDECTDGYNGGCSHTCTNNAGSFTCSCPTGFEISANLMVCWDIDECDDLNGGCSEQCNNTFGSYECNCWDDKVLALDGVTCIGCSQGGIINCADPQSPTNCYDIQQMAPSTASGACDVCLTDCSGGPTSVVTVWCDMDIDGGGWTTFQKRQDGSQTFVLPWVDYVGGFGTVDGGEFWLGLDNINALTCTDSMELHIYMEDAETAVTTGIAHYDSFTVGDSTTTYTMNVGNCITCTVGNSLLYHDGQQFSTIDDDNDGDGGRDCAEIGNGGFWYDSCLRANPNGLYLNGAHALRNEGIEWVTFPLHTSRFYSMAYFDMKVRPA